MCHLIINATDNFVRVHEFFAISIFMYITNPIFQVRYAIHEYACTAVDVIARRLRLSFLNVQATEEALPNIISIMADVLNWSKSKQKV